MGKNAKILHFCATAPTSDFYHVWRYEKGSLVALNSGKPFRSEQAIREWAQKHNYRTLVKHTHAHYIDSD